MGESSAQNPQQVLIGKYSCKVITSLSSKIRELPELRMGICSSRCISAVFEANQVYTVQFFEEYLIQCT
jgi:hypothetical protein